MGSNMQKVTDDADLKYLVWICQQIIVTLYLSQMMPSKAHNHQTSFKPQEERIAQKINSLKVSWCRVVGQNWFLVKMSEGKPYMQIMPKIRS